MSHAHPLDLGQARPGASRRAVLASTIAAGAAGLTAVSAAGARANPTGAHGTAPPRQRNQSSMVGVPFEVYDEVRVGIIGLGNRGMGMLPLFDAVPGVRVTAVCDVRPGLVRDASDRLAAEGSRRPREYSRGPEDYQRLAQADDVDFAYIATPWEDHYAQGVACLEGGKHVGIELPIATELDELWSLVDMSEQVQRHCILMENCNYGRQELAMLRMAHDGLFGDITNGHGGYLHDLRDLLFSETYYYNQWRRKWFAARNRAFYPMHGLAPIAAAMDVNRGDRMTTLQASASPAHGLADYRERHVSADRTDVWAEEYIAGDRVTCMINTEQGRLIRAEDDVCTPRPYSRINTLAGSRGVLEDYPSRIYLEPEHGGHAWQESQPYLDEYDHWLWQDIGDDAENHGGHGGMDYIMIYRLMQCMRQGLEPDIDVYDSAAWSSPVPLSEASLSSGGPVEIPDFSRGLWSEQRAGLDSERAPLLD
ncbi:MAG TPA: Gfo/Idh/MocA family oxidoreductase [Beutenbergiaceae bacterium]|nr:Gfo/Idh/MocA family oxidoreductase [Beutenbergiaceae bacterium]